MAEKHDKIKRAIDKIKLLLPKGSEAQINAAFDEMFAFDKELFGGEYHSAEDMLIFFEMLNIIADNHIRLHNTLDLGIHNLEWTKAFQDFDENAPFSDEEKRPVRLSFLRLFTKVRKYMEREAKGEDVVAEEIEVANSKNIRPENSKCLLCRKNIADKKGSHMAPHMLLSKVFSHEGKKGRDYEKVDRFNMAEGERYEYLGSAILPDDRAEILNHELSAEETEEALHKHNPFTFDHYFCSECEERFSMIESRYAQIIGQNKKTYPRSIPYLFWMSVTWRMSISKIGLILPKQHEEKYRKILDNALSLDKNSICTDSRKLGHCAYTIHEAADTKDEGLGIFGYPTETIPAVYVIGKQIIRFYHSLDKARKVSKVINIRESDINDGTKKEIVVPCDFIDFWKVKRGMMDMEWFLNFEKLARGGKNVSQFLSKMNLEKEHLEKTGEFADFKPITPDTEGYRLTIPRSVFKIISYLQTHPDSDLEELKKETGYTKEEIVEMMSYWLARSEDELNRQ